MRYVAYIISLFALNLCCSNNLYAFVQQVPGEPVLLQNGTATFSQNFGGIAYNPNMAIDNVFYTPRITPAGDCCFSNGWTIARDPGTFSNAESAVWQTVSDVGPSFITFRMFFLDPNPGHLLGRFRWSVTTDDRLTYADGLPIDGNVNAHWTVLKNPVMQIPPGMTFAELGDDSILLRGGAPGEGLYQITYRTELSGITGIRLEALKDSSLPGDGPGFFFNGNFVLTELQLYSRPVPEPAAYTLMLVGVLLLGTRLHRSNQSKRIAHRQRLIV